MLRVTNMISKSIIRYGFSEIQQFKPTPIQKIVHKEGIMAKKILQKHYQLINSSPNDSITEIQGNFIKLKSKLADRHLYIPNKKQYLLKLDRAYDEIMKVHEDYDIFQLYKPQGPMTKQQLIVYQLNKIKKFKRYQLLQSYQVSSIFLILTIIALVIVEQYQMENTPRFKVIDQFAFGRLAKQQIDLFVSSIEERMTKIKGFNKSSAEMIKELQKIGVKVTDPEIVEIMEKQKIKNENQKQVQQS